MEIIRFQNEKKYIKLFLELSKKVYGKNYQENQKEVTQILTGKHLLSKYFTVDNFLFLEDKEPVGRFIMTRYPNDANAYIGYFECIHDASVAKKMFQEANQFAKEKNCKKIIGPMDASFWIKYRLKINKFDSIPYIGEPYNKDYYLKFFLENQYTICEHYISNIYLPVQYDYINEKYQNRYQTFIENGYNIISVELDKFDEAIEELYSLLTSLYQDFPLFKNIDKEDFLALFKDFKTIMDPKMVKLAYYQDKMVGFFISVPNYHTLTANVSAKSLLQILHMKKNPKEYVMLYMGVAPEHQGLGKALVYSILTELKEKKVPSIGALSRDGKITQNYVSDLCIDKYEYVLLERVVK